MACALLFVEDGNLFWHHQIARYEEFMQLRELVDKVELPPEGSTEDGKGEAHLHRRMDEVKVLEPSMDRQRQRDEQRA